jgi:glycerol-3-phosphate dehydrogenase (NAD(P)+)
MAKAWSVLGAGSWGTALAIHLASIGHPTMLWARDPEQLHAMAQTRENKRYLAGITLPPALQLSASLQDCVKQADILLICTPSRSFVPLLQSIQASLKANTAICWACKGLTQDGELLHLAAQKIIGSKHPLALLSGPSFAKEVAQHMPTAMVAASEDLSFAKQIAQQLSHQQCRVYAQGDIIGVEIGGAIKNILAVAAGISDSLGFGSNARAALITRGLAEMMRFGEAMGAEKETLMGLSGLGDLILTCTDNQSRNRRFGLALGQGASIEQASHSIGQVIEAPGTVQTVYQLAQQHHVSMPITEQIHAILHQGRSAKDAVAQLFSREVREEQL